MDTCAGRPALKLDDLHTFHWLRFYPVYPFPRGLAWHMHVIAVWSTRTLAFPALMQPTRAGARIVTSSSKEVTCRKSSRWTTSIDCDALLSSRRRCSSLADAQRSVETFD